MTAASPVKTVPRASVYCCFFAGGIGIGTWAASLPPLSRLVGLSEGDLGLVLLCFGFGAIAAMTNISRIVARFGAGRLALFGACLFGLMIATIAAAGSMLVLALVACLAGAAFGGTDVTMNTEAAALENRAGRPIMSSFHAVFSVGGLLSAAACGHLFQIGFTVATCLVFAGGIVVAISLLGLSLLPRNGIAPPPTQKQAVATKARFDAKRVYILGMVAFIAMFAEGAILDWAAIYIVRIVGASESLGAYGFAIFAGMMAVGRIAGDRATSSFGAAAMLRFGAIGVALALAAALSVQSVPTIFLALGICGLGVANIVPLIFSAAGRLDGDANGIGMSRVLTMGYAGILIGPPFIGFLAQSTSLTVSLSAVAASMLVVAACGSIVGQPNGRPQPSDAF